MRPIRLAVVGAGHLGRIHARLAKQVANIELVAVADVAEANRQQAAAECGVPAVADYRELLGKIDAAVVAVPTSLHHEVALDLLGDGVNLLVEKPLASTVAQAEDLVRTARRQGAVLQVGHVERFNPALASVLPQLGEPKYVTASRLSGFSGRSTDIGVVMDLMIHDIDLVLSLTRSPLRRVEALGMALLGEHEDVAHARLTFENGCVANLHSSRVSFQPDRTMQIWSAAAFATLDFSTRQATVVRPSDAVLGRRIQAERLPAAERMALKDKLYREHLSRHDYQPAPVDAITAELADFADSILLGRTPRVTGEQGRDAVQVAERVLASLSRHQWDGDPQGRVGQHALPRPSVVPAPHWQHQAASRRAG